MAHVKDVAEYFLYLDEQNEGDGISNLKLQKRLLRPGLLQCCIR